MFLLSNVKNSISKMRRNFLETSLPVHEIRYALVDFPAVIRRCNNVVIVD